MGRLWRNSPKAVPGREAASRCGPVWRAGLAIGERCQALPARLGGRRDAGHVPNPLCSPSLAFPTLPQGTGFSRS